MKSKYKKRKYTIETHNPKWKVVFDRESKKLREVFDAKALSIEHIGSTSVHGLSAKPTIDILITVRDIKISDKLSDQIEKLGYTAFGDYINHGSRLFAIEKNNERLVNLHVFEAKHPHVTEMLHLRNYLRTHKEKVTEYSDLKLHLFNTYPNDYGSYRKYKDEWMNKLKKEIF